MLSFLFGAMRVCALIGVICVFSSCAQSDEELFGPTASGSDVKPTNEFPAVVKVVSPGGRGLCTGTFISANTVLTAAHCVLTEGRYTIIASFGMFTTYNVLSYGPGVVDDPNDLALLILSEDVAEADQGQVIPIGRPTSYGEIVTIVGFGCNDLRTRRGSGIKRAGTNKVFDVDDYIQLITPLNNQVGARGITGSDNRSGSCYGDSGGPMARKNADGSYELVGIAHAGGDAGSYTISEYVDMGRSDNLNFVYQADLANNLGIRGI